MTPKEKAKELINKYINLTEECNCLEYMCVCFRISEYKAKECALIAVDEIINVCPYIDLKIRETEDQLSAFDFQFVSYWQEVKQEIEKL